MIKRLALLLMASFVLSGCVPQLGGGNTAGAKDEYARRAFAPGFPPVPLYKSAQVVESYGFEGKFGASLVSGDDLSSVTKFYSQSLPALGWDTNVSAGQANSLTFNIKNQTQQGTVIVNTAADGKMTAITMSISPIP